MSDNGRWFKLWVNAITDNRLSALPNELWAVWAKFGTYIKCHGIEGEITLTKPEKILCSILQCDDFDHLINAIKCFPNVTVTSVTNTSVTYSVKYENWYKYQGDYSGDRVKKFRAKNIKSVTPKKRREEKRREEKKKEDIVAPDFLSQIKSNPAYKEINIDRELAKMDAWLLTPKARGKKKTKAFIVNWLNRIDVSIAEIKKDRIGDSYAAL